MAERSSTGQMALTSSAPIRPAVAEYSSACEYSANKMPASIEPRSILRGSPWKSRACPAMLVLPWK